MLNSAVTQPHVTACTHTHTGGGHKLGVITSVRTCHCDDGGGDLHNKSMPDAAMALGWGEGGDQDCTNRWSEELQAGLMVTPTCAEQSDMLHHGKSET